MEPPSKRPKRNAASVSAARLFNSDSPIAGHGKNIQAFLALCLLSWTGYTEEEKTLIISSLPLPYRTLSYDERNNLVCPITPKFMSEDKVIRDQIARFKREVKNGYHTKTWQEKAKKAMDERSSGKFDEYFARRVEEMFNDDGDDAIDEHASNVGSDGDYRATKPRKHTKKGKAKNKISMETSDALAESDYIMQVGESTTLAEEGNSEMDDVAY